MSVPALTSPETILPSLPCPCLSLTVSPSTSSVHCAPTTVALTYESIRLSNTCRPSFPLSPQAPSPPPSLSHPGNLHSIPQPPSLYPSGRPAHVNMANPLDTAAGSEMFSNYEGELKLVEADLNQKLDQIPELSGEERKQAVRGTERAADEAKELVSLHPPPSTIGQRSRLLTSPAGFNEPREVQCPLPPPVT